MECKFHVGQPVVCIDGMWEYVDFVPSAANPNPKLGEVYTVSAIVPFRDGIYISVIGLEDYYEQEAFRPLVTRKTDISIFTAMLTPKTEQVPA